MRALYDRISPRHTEMCVGTRTAVAFRRRGRSFVVQVPGDEHTPTLQAINPTWEYTMDGQRRLMCTTVDVELYINARRRLLERHNGTLTKFARIATAAGDELNRRPFGCVR